MSIRYNSIDDADLEALARPDYGHYLAQDLWSEILPNLWQGGTADNDTGRQKQKPDINITKFDTVITLYAWANPVDWFVKEIRYGVYDSNVAHMNLEEIFDIVKTTHSEWKRGKKVLVRCQAGWNRSGLVMALVLIREGYSAEEAIAMLRERRSEYALCNNDFVKFLLKQNPADWQGDEFVG